MEKIRLLYLIDRLEVGGAERLLEMACRHLPRERFDIRVDSLFSGGQMAERLRRLGIPVEILCAKNLWDVFGFFRLYKRLRDWKPHILHTHLFPANTFGRAAGRLAGVPVIIGAEHNLYREKPFHQRLADRILSRISDRIHAVSFAVANFTSAQERIPISRFSVLYNFAELAVFNEARARREENRKLLGILPREKALVAVGSLSRQKDHQFLLEVMKELVGRMEGLQLLIVGQGPLRKALGERIGHLGLEGQVSLLGVREDVPEILSACDIFVFPSVWEGFGIALLEAMAAGLPVVASRLDGIPEIVREGEGILLPAGDREAWVSAILDLLQNSEKSRALAAAGQRRSADFSVESGVRRWQNLYEEILKEKGVMV